MPRVSDLPSISSVQTDDQLLVLDVHDLSESSAGTTKKMALSQLPASGSGSAQAVVITTTGATFSPKVALTAGSTATVSWACQGFTTLTGLTPSFSFGTAATRTVYMTVTDANGYDALNQVTLFNVGFDHTNDNGISSLNATYDWASQLVSGISGVNKMKGLQIFCAANIPGLTGTLDFSGLGQLQHIECYNSGLTAVYTSGCTSLVRFCLELNNLTSVNLNEFAPNVADFRCAAQVGGTLAFTPLATQMPNDWHFCVRDQIITTMPSFSNLPNVQQLWMWNTRQTGTMKTYSAILNSLLAHSNNFTAADFSGVPITDAGAYINMAANLLTSCNLTGCTGVTQIRLNDNAFSQATVDGILTTVDGLGTSNGTLDLRGNPAPSGTGATHVTALQGRGWTVTTGPGTISVVQTASAAGGGVSFASPVTAGNSVLIVAGGYRTTAGTVTASAPTLNLATVTGTVAAFNPGGTNGVTSPFDTGVGALVFLTCWLLPNCPAANGLASNITGVTATTGIVAYEIHGLTSATFLANNSNNAQSSTAIDAKSVGAGANNAMVVGCGQIYQGLSVTPAAPWTNTLANTPTIASYRFSTLPTTFGPAEFTWLPTGSSNGPWCAGLAVLS